MELIINDIGSSGHPKKELAIQGSNIRHCLDIMQKEGIKDLAINSQWGWSPKNKNPDFLKDTPWVEGVNIVSEDLDLSVLNGVSHLKRLMLPETFKGILDLSNFPKLELFYGRWNEKQIKNLDKATGMRRVSISRFNKENLMLFRNFKKLEYFRIFYSNILNLHGIENWDSLEEMDLLKLPKLTDISALENLALHLKDFDIEGCKRVTDYSVLEKLIALESIGIAEGNPIKSVSFLKKLPLTSGIIGVEVLDKQLDILQEKGIRYKKFKSYSS